MLWITLVAACAAVAGSIFAFVQAKAATDSRRDAQAAEAGAVTARDAAVAAQQDSAAAAQRIAEVLEARAAAARAAAEQRSNPWQLNAGRYTKNGTAVLLSLVGEHRVADVSIEFERAPYMVRLDPDPVPTEMQPGEAIEIYYMRAGGDSSTSTLIVHWRWEDSSEKKVTRATLN